MKADDQQRSHLRADTRHQQFKIDKSRTFIFENGWGVNSMWVENILQADSWVPTCVSTSKSILHLLINF